MAAGDDKYLSAGYLALGNCHRLKGDLQASIGCYFRSAEIKSQIGDTNGEGILYITIADVYSIGKNHPNAVQYYTKAIQILKQVQDSLSLCAAYINLGDEYFHYEQLDSALKHFRYGAEISEQIENESYAASALGNIGLVYAKQGYQDLAEQNIREASFILRKLGDLYPISVYLTYMADIYSERGNRDRALQYAHESLDIAEELGLKEQIRDASLKLSELYRASGDYRNAYNYQSQYIAYRDSINNEETIRKMADLRTEFEVGQKQAEVDLLTIEKRNQQIILIGTAGFAFLLIILAAIVYKYYQSKNRLSKVLANQKRELEYLNQTKDKFFSIISHDLRGPVSSFHGISRMIKYFVGSKETGQLLEIADDIDRSVDRLSGLLDNLLGWAMQQQGHFPNVPEKLHLNELADDLVKTLGNMASAKQIELTSEINGETFLWADRNMTMTILRNLVSNALKFTPEGGSVTISARQKSDFSEISISDTGVGIPQEKVNKLFTLQDKKSTYGTSGEKGLGLGLQLVYEFIELNGGKIAVKSEEGQGTVFTVSLPLFEMEKIVIEN